MDASDGFESVRVDVDALKAENARITRVLVGLTATNALLSRFLMSRKILTREEVVLLNAAALDAQNTELTPEQVIRWAGEQFAKSSDEIGGGARGDVIEDLRKGV